MNKKIVWKAINLRDKMITSVAKLERYFEKLFSIQKEKKSGSQKL